MATFNIFNTLQTSPSFLLTFFLFWCLIFLQTNIKAIFLVTQQYKYQIAHLPSEQKGGQNTRRKPGSSVLIVSEEIEIPTTNQTIHNMACGITDNSYGCLCIRWHVGFSWTLAFCWWISTWGSPCTFSSSSRRKSMRCRSYGRFAFIITRAIRYRIQIPCYGSRFWFNRNTVLFWSWSRFCFKLRKMVIWSGGGFRMKNSTMVYMWNSTFIFLQNILIVGTYTRSLIIFLSVFHFEILQWFHYCFHEHLKFIYHIKDRKTKHLTTLAAFWRLDNRKVIINQTHPFFLLYTARKSCQVVKWILDILIIVHQVWYIGSIRMAIG